MGLKIASFSNQQLSFFGAQADAFMKIAGSLRIKLLISLCVCMNAKSVMMLKAVASTLTSRTRDPGINALLQRQYCDKSAITFYMLR